MNIYSIARNLFYVFHQQNKKKGLWLCGEKSGKDINKFKDTGVIVILLKIVKPQSKPPVPCTTEPSGLGSSPVIAPI